jgi:hypothetical protein
LKRKFSLLTFFILLVQYSFGYAVLTHEALIDASWEHSILPLLKKQFPSASADDLSNAKAYAYGGAVSPDMGYYPFGNTLFTNLVHYVRSGEMVENLFQEARNLNEYAYAVGFLCHYNADEYGHPIGTNRSVPLVYPKDREKFGNNVTYAEDKIAHLRMEFAFDVLQTARGNYASKQYHSYVGFKVDTSVLARAFEKTYGLNLEKLFGGMLPLAVETFRFAVKNMLPLLTKAAWATKKNDIRKTNATLTSRSFTYRMHQKEYRQEFGNNYKKPGVFSTLISFIIRIMPKIGPLRILKFKAPTPEAEKYFIQSFNDVLTHYTAIIDKLPGKNMEFTDIDFDTGNPTRPGEYSLADDTYAKLLLQLDKNKFENLNSSLKKNLLQYFQAWKAKGTMGSNDDIISALTDLQNQKTID